MSVEVQTYLNNAKDMFRRIETHCQSKRPLTLELADTLYNLSLIKISVGHRENLGGIASEVQSMIDEIKQLYTTAEGMVRELENKSKVPESPIPATKEKAAETPGPHGINILRKNL